MRQFILQNLPDKHGNYTVSGKDYTYLVQVLRLQKNNTLTARIPSGELLALEITEIKSKTLILSQQKKICSKSLQSHEVTASDINENKQLFYRENKAVGYGCEIWLLQGMTKPQKMDCIIRQAVEIGISRVIPLISEYAFTYKENPQNRLERWNRIIREARQQSGSPIDTTLEIFHNIQTGIEAVVAFVKQQSYTTNDVCCFLLSEQERLHTIFDCIFEQKPKLVCLAVGSEGGFSSAETALFSANGFNFLHFSTNVLRAETAAIYGMAILQHLITEFSLWQKNE